MKAVLVLEDGSVFEGWSFGYEGEVAGEVVFNTQVVGYQEILTEPSYRGQIVVMGYPHIGNYGVNERCFESDSGQVAALVVKEYSKIYSNWQATGSLGDFMKKHKIIGIEGIDTRAVTIHLRDKGEMKGIVSTKSAEVKALANKAKEWLVPNLVETIKSLPDRQAGEIRSTKSKITIINLGVNKSTLNKYPGAKVVAYDTPADKILAGEPEQVIISGGPGDPTKLTDLIDEVKKLIGKVPIYGLQNGGCVLALALGCTVGRMKVGHHGVNHPVVDPKTGQGEISAQNHSFGIEKLSDKVKILHVNLNDKTVEKISSKDGSCVAALYWPIDERGKLAPGYQYV